MPNRQFTVGETPTIFARVSWPGTNKPIDPDTVTLTGLAPSRGNPITLTTTAFTRIDEGSFALVIPTDGLAPGAYNYVVTARGTDPATGATKVAKVEDTFVLQAASVAGA